MCERLTGESREDMLARLYVNAQRRADLLQRRCEQAESRALKAERVADRAIYILGLADQEAAVLLAAERAAL
jgi:hypothetical protein